MHITVREIQAQLGQQLNQTSDTASLDAQVLLAHFLEKPRTWILAHPEALLTNIQFDNINQAAKRITHGEPLPYVIGHWEFYGLDFHLTPSVLIPRPETEQLVERAISWLQLHPHKRKSIDVGTGSGCIGISLVKYIPDLHMLMTDLSIAALNVARGNVRLHSLTDSVELIQADLLEAIPGPLDLVCANLPYIPTDLLVTLPIFEKEPRSSLDGGLRGTVLVARLLEQARSVLVSGGLILLEIESSLGKDVETLAHKYYPLSKIHILKDLAGQDRCLEIERPDLLVHICPRSEWLIAQKSGQYRDTSLEQDGFIHCSQPEQVLEVANHFYAGVPDLILLWFDPEKLASEIRWENMQGTMFPHIYGPINLDAICSITNLEPDITGSYCSIQLPI